MKYYRINSTWHSFSFVRYHVPRSWFHPTGKNTLVIFEETGGHPTKISFSKRQKKSVCAFVSEDYPSSNLDLPATNNIDSRSETNKLQLSCPDGSIITSITFASFGNPSGTCQSYIQGNCHSRNSHSVVEKVCIYMLWYDTIRGTCFSKLRKTCVNLGLWRRQILHFSTVQFSFQNLILSILLIHFSPFCRLAWM